MEMFKALCDISVYGDNIGIEDNDRFVIPLHRCDIYGSKKSGKRLLYALLYYVFTSLVNSFRPLHFHHKPFIP